jgi:hypothetical protein
MRKIKLRMAIYSHLSDTQTMIYINDKENATLRINFVKMLVDKLDEGVDEMSENELNSLWAECKKQFN